jgi:hypothetical protein
MPAGCFGTGVRSFAAMTGTGSAAYQLFLTPVGSGVPCLIDVLDTRGLGRLESRAGASRPDDSRCGQREQAGGRVAVRFDGLGELRSFAVCPIHPRQLRMSHRIARGIADNMRVLCACRRTTLVRHLRHSAGRSPRDDCLMWPSGSS